MLLRLLLVFIIVPIMELAILIEIGSRIGTLNTILLIIITGILGASLARYEGFRAISMIRTEMERGAFPAQGMVDGLLILMGGLLLLTPGILTDILGLLAIIPFTRPILRRQVMRYIRRRMDSGGVYLHF